MCTTQFFIFFFGFIEHLKQYMVSLSEIRAILVALRVFKYGILVNINNARNAYNAVCVYADTAAPYSFVSSYPVTPWFTCSSANRAPRFNSIHFSAAMNRPHAVENQH
jgi:hypothetical protein